MSSLFRMLRSRDKAARRIVAILVVLAFVVPLPVSDPAVGENDDLLVRLAGDVVSLRQRLVALGGASVAVARDAASKTTNAVATNVANANDPFWFLARGVSKGWWSSVTLPMPTLSPPQLRALKTSGFTHVRFPLNPRAIVSETDGGFSVNCDQTVPQELRNFMDAQVKAARDAGMALMFTISAGSHKEITEWIGQDPSGARLASIASCVVKAAVDVDRAFAKSMIAFGTLNEPFNMPKEVRQYGRAWGGMQEGALQSVRAEYPDALLIAQGAYATSISTVTALSKLPIRNVAYEFHYYMPGPFSFQGLPGWPGFANIGGVHFPADPGAECVAKRYHKNGAYDCLTCADDRDPFCKAYHKTPHEQFTVDYIDQQFRALRDWANGAPVYLGEYGTTLPLAANSPACPTCRFSGPERADRLRWFAAVQRAASENGFYRSVYMIDNQMGVVRDASPDDVPGRSSKIPSIDTELLGAGLTAKRANTTSAAVNRAPIINSITGPTTIAVGAPGAWTINAADPDGDAMSYRMWWGDRLNRPTPSATTTQSSHTLSYRFTKTGTFTIFGTVFDASGLSTTRTGTVTVVPNTTR